MESLTLIKENYNLKQRLEMVENCLDLEKLLVRDMNIEIKKYKEKIFDLEHDLEDLRNLVDDWVHLTTIKFKK